MARKFVVGALRAACVREVANLTSRAGRSIANLFALAAATASPRSSMEQLEDRRLLAGVALTSGVLTLTGSSDMRNTLTVTASGSNYIAKANGISKTFASSSVSQIKIIGANWNDTISIASGITKPSHIEGRDGNDSISGGGGNDTIYGGGYNDSLYGNAGNDAIYGEAGNDYVDGGAGSDKGDGGTGTDTVKNVENTVVAAPTPTATTSVTSFQLWNSGTNKVIKTINSGETLDLATLPSQLTIVAQTSGSVGSVKFSLDSTSSYRLENSAPWSISGEFSSTDLADWTVPTGGHTITATPYTKTNAGGSVGTSKSISINVIRSTGGSTGGTSGGTTGGSTGGTTGGTGTAVGGVVPRSSTAAAPSAIITAVSSKTIHAGQSFHAHAMGSALNGGTPLTARYVWDFGDSGSKYNTLQGFNASHHYSKAGTYTVKLTLSNEAGKTDVETTTVTVLDAGRKKIYVSTSGNDSNTGLSESSPLRTWSKAVSKVTDNVEILFRGGDSFDVAISMNIYTRNVVVGSYGSGRATLKYTGPRDYSSMIWFGGQGSGERTVNNLIFDSIYTGTDASGAPQGVGASGTGDAVLNSEFRNVGYAVNTSAGPSGVLIQDNNAPLSTGLKEYFLWAQGKDLVLLGNNVVNTLRGADVRSAGADRMLLAYNTMSNPVDADGIQRGTITIHEGSYIYAANNTFKNGAVAVGPLGQGDGITEKSSRLRYVVLEGNTVTDSGVLVMHGTEHFMARNNVVKRNNTWAFQIEGYNSTYGRGVVDTTFANNTVINSGTIGNLLWVGGDVSGINLINNLFLAPNLATGTSSSAPVFVYDSDLGSFNKITGNVWPTPTISSYAAGGINYVWPTWSNAAGYKTPAEWEAYGVVLKDYYQDVSYNASTYAPSTSSLAADAGVVWAGVFTDMNGKMRSSTGAWTAGAVEV